MSRSGALVGSLGRERTVLLSTHVMQEVEATCSRLVILSNGRLAAKGEVQELIASRTGGVRYVVEAAGPGVADGLAGLEGVTSHRSSTVEGRERVELVSDGTAELRPRIFEMARDRRWTLWELHREKATLEQLFRSLTAAGEAVADEPASSGALAEAAVETPAAGPGDAVTEEDD